MSLLPSHHVEFRSKDYWDRFFLERGGEKFEWYGTYNEIEANVKRSMKYTDKLLIIGCGNSEISADLYDNGYKSIVNLDFSPLVIQEMINKNTKRSSMKWDVGDMTLMPEYRDNEYDIVFDKGDIKDDRSIFHAIHMIFITIINPITKAMLLQIQSLYTLEILRLRCYCD
jgi:hypothetical protein